MYEYKIIPGLSENTMIVFTLVILALNVAAFIALFWPAKPGKERTTRIPAFFFLLIPVAFIVFYFPQPHVPSDNYASFNKAEAQYKDDIKKAAATDIHGVVFEVQQNDNPMSKQTREGSMKIPTLRGVIPCTAYSTPGLVKVQCQDGRTLPEIAEFNDRATASAVKAFKEAGLELREKLDSKVASGRQVNVIGVWDGQAATCEIKLTARNVAAAECLNEKIEVVW